MVTRRDVSVAWRRRLGSVLRRRRGAPRVTVVIPTYNWATVLPWSIGSVRAQSFTEWELWVIGDGCTDESAATVAAVDDPRIHWYNLAANGRSQVGPNNAALERAAGEYVAYLGHDDLWLPDHLRTLTGALDAGAPFACARQLRIDPGRAPYVSPHDGYVYTVSDWIAPTSMMHRRDDARSVGGWRFPDPSSMCDPEADLWARLAERRGPPSVIEAVTSVKLPAALRRGVYRERPCDEQAAWWERIRGARDSAAFVADALSDPALRPPARYDLAAVPPGMQDGTVPAAERHRLSRIHKGLDDKGLDDKGLDDKGLDDT
jgi:glycosyltransferase involved in cell wall biosynthesis